jgi:hypothetical protein
MAFPFPRQLMCQHAACKKLHVVPISINEYFQLTLLACVAPHLGSVAGRTHSNQRSHRGLEHNGGVDSKEELR